MEPEAAFSKAAALVYVVQFSQKFRSCFYISTFSFSKWVEIERYSEVFQGI
jgi:hypothetical protein